MFRKLKTSFLTNAFNTQERERRRNLKKEKIKENEKIWEAESHARYGFLQDINSIIEKVQDASSASIARGKTTYGEDVRLQLTSVENLKMHMETEIILELASASKSPKEMIKIVQNRQQLREVCVGILSVIIEDFRLLSEKSYSKGTSKCLEAVKSALGDLEDLKEKLSLATSAAETVHQEPVADVTEPSVTKVPVNPDHQQIFLPTNTHSDPEKSTDDAKVLNSHIISDSQIQKISLNTPENECKSEVNTNNHHRSNIKQNPEESKNQYFITVTLRWCESMSEKMAKQTEVPQSSRAVRSDADSKIQEKPSLWRRFQKLLTPTQLYPSKNGKQVLSPLVTTEISKQSLQLQDRFAPKESSAQENISGSEMPKVSSIWKRFKKSITPAFLRKRDARLT